MRRLPHQGAVSPDRKVIKESRDRQVLRGRRDRKVIQDRQALLVHKALRVKKGKQVPWVHRGQRELRGQKAMRGQQVLPGQPESEEKKVTPDPPDLRGYRDLRVQKGILETPEEPNCLLQPIHGLNHKLLVAI